MLHTNICLGTFRVTVREVPDDNLIRPPRTNMFVMATIYTDGGSAPVKIRNLSATGALIEGDLVPSRAAAVSLRRGELIVTGKIVWCSNGRAGLQFETPISVVHWLPGGEVLLKKELVSAAFHCAKTGIVPNSTAPEPPFEAATPEEIIMAKDRLEVLADALADDADVLMRHGERLQSLDFAIQILGKLSRRSTITF